MNNFCSYIYFTLAFLFVFFRATLSQGTTCPFKYLYHFGDGVTDIGNSIRILPWGPSLPAAHLPYGRTFPGYPTGRWGDGRIDFDYAAADFGFPRIVPYLSSNATSSNGVIFSVARSPVLDHKFFKSKGIEIPPYAVPLLGQLNWFKKYLKTVCKSKTECANRLANSLILLGDIEGNDVGYSLLGGKSIKEVETYVPYIVKTQIKTARELLKLGAQQLIIPGSTPIGCYPYILTTFASKKASAYDALGCLKSANDLIKFKNRHLEQAVANLRKEFPEASIMYAAFDQGVLQHLNNTLAGPNRKNTFKACCGIGGKYNYDSKRFCGSRGVPVCRDPNNYIFWDGLHLTQEASLRIERILIQPALSNLKCVT